MSRMRPARPRQRSAGTIQTSAPPSGGSGARRAAVGLGDRGDDGEAEAGAAAAARGVAAR